MYGLSHPVTIRTIAERSALLHNALCSSGAISGTFWLSRESGSTLSAAKILGVNQTTVARRVAALEEALREKLFEKTAGGYRLTELGAAMVQSAERVENGGRGLCGRMVAQRSRKLLGMIRVTTNDVLADCLLTPWLREFTQRFPVVQVETVITDRQMDLSRGEADIALRAATLSSGPMGDGVVVRRLATGKWGVLCLQGIRR
jgi:DNA-binding transcriptional LysR family regulator